MAITVSLTWDAGQIARLRGAELDKALTRAVRNAGDKAARALVKDAVKYIRGRKNLKSAFIRDGMKLRRPGQGASLESMAWKLWVRGKQVPLAQYPHRAGKRGVRVRVNKGGGEVLPGAFVTSVGSGHRGIFVRKSKARSPIKELFSSRITDVLQDGGAIDRLFDAARARMASDFDRQIEAQLAKLGGR